MDDLGRFYKGDGLAELIADKSELDAKPDGRFVTREVRFVIGDQFSDVYVFVDADKHCPKDVQGWHVKRFPTSTSIKDVFEAMCSSDSPLMWPFAEIVPLMLTGTDLERVKI